MRFFEKYGGKSVAFGRFVGPMRAVIPLVAGMMGMPTGRFLAANILSAIVWAPVYLLPGIVFGASLELAAEAQRMHATESGRRLGNLARWLAAGKSDEPRRSPDHSSRRGPESQAS